MSEITEVDIYDSILCDLRFNFGADFKKTRIPLKHSEAITSANNDEWTP